MSALDEDIFSSIVAWHEPALVGFIRDLQSARRADGFRGHCHHPLRAGCTLSARCLAMAAGKRPAMARMAARFCDGGNCLLYRAAHADRSRAPRQSRGYFAPDGTGPTLNRLCCGLVPEGESAGATLVGLWAGNAGCRVAFESLAGRYSAAWTAPKHSLHRVDDF